MLFVDRELPYGDSRLMCVDKAVPHGEDNPRLGTHIPICRIVLPTHIRATHTLGEDDPAYGDIGVPCRDRAPLIYAVIYG